jgi:hypothetical protein
MHAVDKSHIYNHEIGTCYRYNKVFSGYQPSDKKFNLIILKPRQNFESNSIIFTHRKILKSQLTIFTFREIFKCRRYFPFGSWRRVFLYKFLHVSVEHQ